MKKLAIVFVCIVVFFLGIGIFLQSPFVKKKVVGFLNRELAESPIRIEAGQIVTLFPSLEMRDVTLYVDDWTITCQRVQGKVSLLRTLAKEVSLSNLEADQIRFTHTPQEKIASSPPSPSSPLHFNIQRFKFKDIEFPNAPPTDMSGSFSFQRFASGKETMEGKANLLFPLAYPTSLSFQAERDPQKAWMVSPIKIENGPFQTTGSLQLSEQGNVEKGSFQIQSDLLSFQTKIPLSFRFFAEITLQKEAEGFSIRPAFRIPVLQIDGFSISNLQGHGAFQASLLDAKGTFSSSFSFSDYDFEATSQFEWEKGIGFHFSDCKVESPIFQLTSNLFLSPDFLVDGTTTFSTPQIQEIIPEIYAAISGDIVWKKEGSDQMAHCDLKATNCFFRNLQADQLTLFADILDPFHERTGFLSLDVEGGKWRSLTMHRANLEISKKDKEAFFQMNLEGNWKHPLFLNGQGSWKENELLLSSLNGSFFNHPLQMTESMLLKWGPSSFLCPSLSLQIGEGLLSAFLSREGTEFQSDVTLTKMPLDVLSLNPLETSVAGIADITFHLAQKKEQTCGNLQATLKNVQLGMLGQETDLTSQGSFEAHLQDNRCFLEGCFLLQDTPLFSCEMEIPVHLTLFPFKPQFLYNEDVRGHLSLQGEISQWLDFFDLGTHHLTGSSQCILSVRNTLGSPLVEGEACIKDGFYQNYQTGTELHQLNARFSAHQEQITLDCLTATDAQKTGTFTAQGSIELAPAQHFPFEFHVDLNRFQGISLSLLTSELEGNLDIRGNLKEGLALGKIDIIHSDIMIPSRVPRTIPELQVVYKHPQAPLSVAPLQSISNYPLHLNIGVNAPGSIFISGRGLKSEWKGQVLVGGTQAFPIVQGQIELVQGAFLFSGREFKLTQGSLLFNSQESTLPYLNLSANLEVKDITITAHLKGPINNPQIVLQSAPPLPMGTIMSYLLFGQDLAEINSFQALQLAESVTTLLGEGPNLLESTRKSLGIDRIQILTIPSKTKEGEESVSVQVGKYVAEGVLVSYSQGAEQSSTNIKVEVEGSHGFSFILETDQTQEQGKFSIRWNHIY